MRHGHIAFAALVLTGCAGGCGASQHDAETAVGYAQIIAECDAREEALVERSAFREDAEEQLEIERARCTEEKRSWREAHGVVSSGTLTVQSDDGEEVDRGE